MLLLLAAVLVGASPASAGKSIKPGVNTPKEGGALDPSVTPTTPSPAPTVTPTTPAPAPAGKVHKPGVHAPKQGGALEPGVTPTAPTTAPTTAPAGQVIKPPVNIPTGGVFQPATPPPPPEVKGWPHSILTGATTNCARNPLPHEVLVYRDPNFTGQCAVLVAGFYPYAANLLVGNDAISAIKVGSAVRARIFKDPVFAGDWNAYAPGTMAAGLGGFNDKITSIRVEPANRSQLCDDLREGRSRCSRTPTAAATAWCCPATSRTRTRRAWASRTTASRRCATTARAGCSPSGTPRSPRGASSCRRTRGSTRCRQTVS
ncbi:hypothetical protein [Nannocystis pusilla]|uniref:hypothetical protein n=1 Tax=Nannocystis pusilla TaxID=889268 RepID=UPI003B77056C